MPKNHLIFSTITLITICYPIISLANDIPIECKSVEANALVNQAYKSQYDKAFVAKQRLDPNEPASLVYEKLTDYDYKNGDFKDIIIPLDISLTQNADTQLLAVREVAYDNKNKTRTCEAVVKISISGVLIENYQELIPNDIEFRDFTNQFKNKEIGTFNIKY
uniref:hypothetical protein n=1 Tax=Acinetobacter sp. YH16039 TaxID=2601184 RepID=UPI0015D45275